MSPRDNFVSAANVAARQLRRKTPPLTPLLAPMRSPYEKQFPISSVGYKRVRTPHLAKESMYKMSGHLPYYAESMFPPMEMDEHREDRRKLEARIVELEKQLRDYAKELPNQKTVE